MFPEFNYNYTEYKEGCWEDFKVIPRPTWITTEFGGHVSDFQFHKCLSTSTFFSEHKTIDRHTSNLLLS